MPQHQNVAVVWGIGTNDIAVAAGKLLRINGQTYTPDSEMMEHRSRSGEVIGRSRWNFSKTLELEVYPASSTIADAVDALVGTPTIGTAVTLTELLEDGATNSGIAGAYEVMAAVRNASPTDRVTIRLTLLQNAGFTPGSVITS